MVYLVGFLFGFFWVVSFGSMHVRAAFVLAEVVEKAGTAGLVAFHMVLAGTAGLRVVSWQILLYIVGPLFAISPPSVHPSTKGNKYFLNSAKNCHPGSPQVLQG